MPPKTIEELLKETKIYQILRPKLVLALPTTTLQDALDLMRAEKTGYIVIADIHSKLLGVFTERDVLMKVLKKGVNLSEPVEKYMNTNIHSLNKSNTVGEALDVMKEYGVRHIPLVDEFGQVSGILSIRTIVNFLAELFPTEVFNLPPKADQVHETQEGG
ncbi:MAG: CBS domain-containing protein [Candidatus Omnitrophica bacterium]|nr:CBS domain-containing protein [Candidatus Omnitrophota bacterium]